MASIAKRNRHSSSPSTVSLSSSSYENNNEEDCNDDYVCLFSSSPTPRDATELDAKQKNPPVAPDLTKEFNQLSIEERNQVYEDIHGSTKCIPEHPQLLQSSLDAMQRAIDLKLPQLQESNRDEDRQKAAAYRMALQKGPAHVHDAKLRLAFLRSERFDADAAADRFLNYFDALHDIYGPHVLGRHVTMADLGPSELAELKCGHVQFLTERDTAGRAIQFLDPIPLMAMYAGDEASELVAIRACFYMVMRTMMGSVETQRNGVCSVFYEDAKVGQQVEDFKFPRGRFLKTVGRCFTSVPMRVASVHFVYNDERLLPFMYLFQFALGRVIRARFRICAGPALACRRALVQYGVPVSAMPISEEGVITYNKHGKLLRKYREREAPENADIFDWDKAEFLPKRNDVLLGRGTPYQNHFGNLMLRDMISRACQEYDSARGRGEKAAIAKRIVEEIQSTGGRFLKLDDVTQWWVPATLKEAQLKTSQGFRKKREMDLKAACCAKKDVHSGKRTKVQQSLDQTGIASAEPLPLSLSTASPLDAEILPTVYDKSRSGIDIHEEGLAIESYGLDLGDSLVSEGSGADSLSPRELEYLMEGQSQSEQPPPTLQEFDMEDSNAFWDALHIDTKTCDDPYPLVNKFLSDHEKGIFDIDVNALALAMSSEGTRGSTEQVDPLLQFLESHRDCLKCSPKSSLSWLRGQDIMTLNDLNEACQDDDFLDLEFKAKGGLKGFKRFPFIKAVASAMVP